MAETLVRSSGNTEIGLAVISLLRPLSMFAGLTDDELRKLASLFVQKLYRPGARIFAKGDSGDEACIVLRGKINIHLEPDSPPVDQLGEGKIFGEMAFLDGMPRVAHATASTASILFVITRTAFDNLVEQDPRLGLIIMRNVARDLAFKLRVADKRMQEVGRN